MSLRSSACVVVSALSAVLLITGGLRAHQTPGQGRPTFRAKLELIQIDVTVLGPDGRPLHGLTAEDFTLVDEGKPQPILGFAEVRIPDATDGPVWLNESSPDVRTASDGRVLVFVLDDGQIRDDLRTRATIETMRRIAGEVIDRMGPTDVAAVICTYDTRCAQDFTSDRALLRAAVAKFTPKSFNATALSKENGRLGAFRPYDWSRQSAGVAASVVKYLIEQPGRRKSLIYVSPMLPIRPEVWPPVVCPALDGHCVSLEEAVTEQQMMRTFEDAFRSKVTVYGISPHGLQAIAADSPVALIESQRAAAAPGAPVRMASPKRSLATETGGFVVQGDGSFAEGIAQIFRETGSYYLLGYEKPTNPVTEYHPIPGYRTLDVRVNRPGAVVRGRLGYVEEKPAAPVTNPPSVGDSALAGILPKSDLALRVSVAPFAVPGKADTALAIVLGVPQPASSERTLERLDVQVRAFTPRGEPRGMSRQPVDARLSSSRDDVLLEVMSDLRLKPGVYALRVSATSDRLGTTGSVYTDVEIPDFAKALLSLSGLLLTVEPSTEQVAGSTLAPIVNVLPTTLRDFTARHRVSAFVRVYQGGKGPIVPVTLTARVLDATNRVVVDHAETLEAGRFGAGRAADFQYTLPMPRLTPGLHLLRLEAVAGAMTVRRDARFTLR